MLYWLIGHWWYLTGGVLLGYVVGLLTGFFGAGGGFIMTPVLNIFLGLEMNFAVGTSACQVVGTSVLSLYHHKLERHSPSISPALIIGLGIPPGAYTGAELVQLFKNRSPWVLNGHMVAPVDLILLTVFAFFLLVVGSWLLFDSFVRQCRRVEGEENIAGWLRLIKVPPVVNFRSIPSGSFSVAVMLLLGIFVGFLSGLLGIGGGVIMLPMLVYLVGQQTKYATLTTTLLALLASLFATVFHAVNHNIDYLLVAILMCGAWFGTKHGSALHRKVSGKTIRKYFGLVVIVAWLLVIFKLFRILV